MAGLAEAFVQKRIDAVSVTSTEGLDNLWQLADDAMTDGEALPSQGLSQLAGTLAGPPQRGHRVATGLGGDQGLQGIEDRRGLLADLLATAPQAAGTIHTEIQDAFVKAEAIGWQELVECGGYAPARDKGLLRIEGRDYVVRDGDVITIKV